MKRGSREIGKSERISSKHVRHRYRIFQNFRSVAVTARPVDGTCGRNGGPSLAVLAAASYSIYTHARAMVLN